jgi:hypothetical protein
MFLVTVGLIGCRSELITSDTSAAPTTARIADAESTIVTVPTHAMTLEGVVELVAEGYDACARTDRGDVWCWGSAAGALPVHAALPGPASRIAGVGPFCIELAATKEWLCRRLGYWFGPWDHPFASGAHIREMWQTEAATLLAIDGDGMLLRWSPPLLTMSAQERTPVRFRSTGIGPVSAISPNGFCFSSPSQEVSCLCNWNYTLLDSHEIPLATCHSPSGAVPVRELRGATAVLAAPGRDVCAILADGHADCMHNAPDLTGVETFVNRAELRGIGRVKSFASSTTDVRFGFSCVIAESGDVRCWGLNDYHALGVATPPPDERGVEVPVRIDMPKVVTVALGGTFGCGLSEDHRVYCWGDNRYGQCGYGSYVGREPSLRGTPHGQREDSGAGDR